MATRRGFFGLVAAAFAALATPFLPKVPQEILPVFLLRGGKPRRVLMRDLRPGDHFALSDPTRNRYLCKGMPVQVDGDVWGVMADLEFLDATDCPATLV